MKPFQLVGARDYVQGSQMVARAAEAVAGDAVLTACAFRRLVAEQVELCAMAPDALLPPDACGDATFLSGGSIRRIGFVPTGLAAPRVAESARWSLLETAPPQGLSGSYAFDGAEDFEAALELVIRALKQLHAALAADARHIWFTGCRKSELTTALPARSGALVITPLRIMMGRPAHQTLTSIALDFGNGLVQRAVISFAFQSEQFTHAA